MVRSLLARLFAGGSAERDCAAAVEETSDDPESDSPEAETAAQAEETNDVWDLIPSWEYDGKYVQSGGHSRGEQERALGHIQRQAEEIERSETDGEPDRDR